MLLLLFGCFNNSSSKKSTKQRLYFPMEFEGEVFYVSRIKFPYQHIGVMKLKNLKYEEEFSTFKSRNPYFRFIGTDSAEILTVMTYGAEVGDKVNFNYKNQKLEYYRNGKLKSETKVTTHKRATEFYIRNNTIASDW